MNVKLHYLMVLLNALMLIALGLMVWAAIDALRHRELGLAAVCGFFFVWTIVLARRT